jgi:hypothetical protein
MPSFVIREEHRHRRWAVLAQKLSAGTAGDSTIASSHSEMDKRTSLCCYTAVVAVVAEMSVPFTLAEGFEQCTPFATARQAEGLLKEKPQSECRRDKKEFDRISSILTSDSTFTPV